MPDPLAYVAGVLSLPAAILTWVAFKFVLLGTSEAARITLARIPDRRTNRALAGGLVFASRRLWFASIGEVGFALLVGRDAEQHIAAVKRLDPPFSLNDLPFKPKETPDA